MGKGDNGSGLSYALDVPTLNKAEADNVAKTQHFNGATKAQADAAAALGASTAASAAADAADAAAGAAKAATAGAFSLGNYKDAGFKDAEAAKDAAIKAKEASLDASLKAHDDKVAKTLIEARKQRDLDASTAAKAASDANLKANHIELPGRRINSREVRTRTDTSSETRRPLPRPPKSKESMTREKEPTEDSSRPSPHEQLLIESSMQKSIKLKYYNI